MTEAVTATGARYPDFFIVGAAKSGTTYVTRPPPMNPNTRLRLTEVVRPDVERLQELLGRDLSAWVDPRSQPGLQLDP